jgi:hypothetical protein
MKHLFTSVFLLSASFLSYSQNTMTLEEGQSSPKAGINDVAWIAGHWQGEAFGGMTEEIWSPPMGDAMMAAFRLVKDGKTDFYEIEAITEENGSLVLRLKHFATDLKGWEEKDERVDFPLVKLKPNKAYFDGMTFEKISEEEMNIYVVIRQKDGSQNEMKFPYRLVD